MNIAKKLTKATPLFWFITIIILSYFGYIQAKEIFAHFVFTPIWNVSLGWVIFAENLIFFTYATTEYIKTSDKRMALFACSFLTAGLFEIMHLSHSEEGTFQLVYSTLANLAYAAPGFISIFYLKNPYTQNKNFYFFNILTLNLIFFGYASYLGESLLTREITDKIFLLNGTEMIWAASYFLIAIIFANVRQAKELSPISKFSIGYFFMFLNEVYIPIGGYFTSLYRLFIHLAMIVAIIFIGMGLKDIQITIERYSNKLKSFISPFLYLVAIYVLVLLLSSDAFKVLMPIHLQYYFLVFFILLTLTTPKEEPEDIDEK